MDSVVWQTEQNSLGALSPRFSSEGSLQGISTAPGPSVMGFYKRSKHLQLKGIPGTHTYCSWISGDITLMGCYNNFVVTCTRRVDVPVGSPLLGQ
jgi:hypothetical protein